MNEEIKKLTLDHEEELAYLAFINAQKENGQTELALNMRITPQFTFFDYNHDGIKELITKTIVSFEACPITKTYYSTYRFSKDGIRQLEGWFHGSYLPTELNIPFD
ncbi:hypothetical protein [Paenibacillus sp. N3.4]|uniref:hypothetical protein n=1 Tax=Paenibacillus sp. N3.4 TaxID=2603222 RepID=UPI0011D38BEE|nr:hypothetical protein [Paenibacillus sp. N3.4]TXK84141.1 hypothetical protein FU659_09810 [Paenibacillus sp. N3.4]